MAWPNLFPKSTITSFLTDFLWADRLSAVRAQKEPEFIWANFNMSEKLKQKERKKSWKHHAEKMLPNKEKNKTADDLLINLCSPEISIFVNGILSVTKAMLNFSWKNQTVYLLEYWNNTDGLVLKLDAPHFRIFKFGAIFLQTDISTSAVLPD